MNALLHKNNVPAGWRLLSVQLFNVPVGGYSDIGSGEFSVTEKTVFLLAELNNYLASPAQLERSE